MSNPYVARLEAQIARYEAEKDPYAPHNKQQLDEMADFINAAAVRIKEVEAERDQLRQALTVIANPGSNPYMPGGSVAIARAALESRGE